MGKLVRMIRSNDIYGWHERKLVQIVIWNVSTVASAICVSNLKTFEEIFQVSFCGIGFRARVNMRREFFVWFLDVN